MDLGIWELVILLVILGLCVAAVAGLVWLIRR
jgi:hypothetical protein